MLYHYGFPQHVWDIITSYFPKPARWEDLNVIGLHRLPWGEYKRVMVLESMKEIIKNTNQLGKPILEYMYWRKYMFDYIEREGLLWR